MSKISKRIIFLISIFLLSSCGYKVLDNSKLKNYNIKEMRTYGDKRTNWSADIHLISTYCFLSDEEVRVFAAKPQKYMIKEIFEYRWTRTHIIY